MRASTAPLEPLPLDTGQSDRLEKALAGLSPEQLHWVSGYAAGLAASQAGRLPAPAAAPVAATGDALTILYGSQTGNGQAIAERLAAKAREKGFGVSLQSLADYKPSQLKREKLLGFVVSTHGEGDPPDDAELFHEFLLSKKAPPLAGVRYSVLALGDSSYLNFCQTGREFDERLAALGAERLHPLVECDVDYEGAAQTWIGDVLSRLPEVMSASTPVPQLRAVSATPRYDRNRPFRAEVLANQKVTGRGSTKDVHHIELSLEDSGLRYSPGDALAVIVSNPPALVRQLLDELGLSGDTEVTVGGETASLEEALASKLEITATSMGFLKAWAGLGAAPLAALLDGGDKSALAELIDGYQVIDVVRRFPLAVDAQALAGSLRRLSARSYSIASSQRANPDEVHLTVAAVRYEAFGSAHWGAASTHLADRLAEGDSVAVYVEPNSRFHLPENDTTDIIMIGPGTGVAPFRAFVEEREARGAAGRNWLFFGDRTFADDFLYQLEWQRHLKSGALTRLDLAFSRDQAQKVYVQDRIRERGADIHAWLGGGAALYVCGDAKNMAGDVENALVDVLVAHGGLTDGAARQRLKELRRDGRYQRDVY
ncbi:MAG TPA: assimilatory sulfite reductase (NADPH) flavoprotein subunit [Woeseiaceae bacterium]|nr:assimilatory sulfite reductase (NADPH) flavoprotein subunit [Woeseiaceae bacterium]